MPSTIYDANRLMTDQPAENSQPPRDELEALRARVEELEAAQPIELELKDLASEIRSVQQNNSKTIVYLVIGMLLGHLIYGLFL